MKALIALVPVLFAGSLSAQVVINEIRTDQSGTDDDEYFELHGPAGTDLTGLTYLVIGDSTSAGAGGHTESVTDLTGMTIPSSGYFVAAESTFTLSVADMTTTLDFENNDNVTHLLVSGYTGTGVGQDLDLDDTGGLDGPVPWTALLDVVALIETVGSGDLTYGKPNLGPNGTFVPGHAFRFPNGDADFYSWNIGDFSPGVDDTPGAANGVGYVDTSFGEAHEMILNHGSVGTGLFYWVVGSFSGTAPGTPLGSVLLPLNIDGYTTFTINNANSPTLANSATITGAATSMLGIDQATLNVPADPSLAGLSADHAYVLIDFSAGVFAYASGSVPVNLI